MNQVTENVKTGWGRRIALALPDAAEEELQKPPPDDEYWVSGGVRYYGPRDDSYASIRCGEVDD